MLHASKAIRVNVLEDQEQTVLYVADDGLCGRCVLQSVADRYCYVIAHNQFA